MPKKRWQFSLKTLLIVVTLGVLMMALWATNHKLQGIRDEYQNFQKETKNEIEKYRAELGELTISDPKKVHAAQIPTFDGTWRWRVYIPEGRTFMLNECIGKIPRTGYPGGSSTDMNSGEYVIQAGLTQDLEGRQVFAIKYKNTSMASMLDKKDIVWLQKFNKEPKNSSGVIGGATQSVEPGEPLLLIRSRVMKKTKRKGPDGTVIGSSTRTSPGPANGVMIWIEDPDGKKALKAGKNTSSKP